MSTMVVFGGSHRFGVRFYRRLGLFSLLVAIVGVQLPASRVVGWLPRCRASVGKLADLSIPAGILTVEAASAAVSEHGTNFPKKADGGAENEKHGRNDDTPPLPPRPFHTIIGVVLNLLASFAAAFGDVLIRLSYLKRRRTSQTHPLPQQATPSTQQLPEDQLQEQAKETRNSTHTIPLLPSGHDSSEMESAASSKCTFSSSPMERGSPWHSLITFADGTVNVPGDDSFSPHGVQLGQLVCSESDESVEDSAYTDDADTAPSSDVVADTSDSDDCPEESPHSSQSVRAAENPPTSLRAYFKCDAVAALWISGILSTALLCPFLNIAGTFFLPASVTGFAALQIVMVMILAKYFLNEHTPPLNLLGAVFVVAGLVLLSLTAGGDPFFSNESAFFSFLLTRSAAVYFSLTSSVIICGLALYADSTASALARVTRGCLSAATAKGVRAVLLPAAAGCAGAYAGLSAKAISMAISSIFAEKPLSFLAVLNHWRAVFILGSAGVCALIELTLLNRSLKKYRAVSVVPIMNGAITLGAGTGGLLVFREYPSDGRLWGLGLGLILLGVASLAYGDAIIKKLHAHATAAACGGRRFVQAAARAARYGRNRYRAGNSMNRIQPVHGRSHPFIQL
eukprot:GHVT01031685.1.p1 GENE.GHVT01031685.1~~GHVT01031685.1.p1  ORF type:complete len:625 (-),score=64.57 GHVT01031685.1:1850-3724(-)